MSKDKSQIVIIGGGVVGASVALHAAWMGFGSITLLERQYVGSGSSGLSASILSRHFTGLADILLRSYGFGVFGDLERTQALPITRNGNLELGGAHTDVSVFEEAVESLRRAGVFGVQMLTPTELKRLVPDLETGDLGFGFYDPDSGFTDGYLVSTALSARARELGVRQIVNCTVQGATSRGDEVDVHTSEGTYRADVVVNAAGPWASQVGDLLGAPVQLVPQRHEICVVEVDSPLSYAMPFVLEPEWPDDPFRLYTRHEGPQRLLVGVHTDQLDALPTADPDHFSQQIDDEYVEMLGERLLKRFPTLATPSLVRGWAGLYPLTPDGYPVIGFHPDNANVLLAVGAGSSGIQMSPTMGRIAAEILRYGMPLDPVLADSVTPSRAGSGVTRTP